MLRSALSATGPGHKTAGGPAAVGFCSGHVPRLVRGASECRWVGPGWDDAVLMAGWAGAGKLITRYRLACWWCETPEMCMKLDLDLAEEFDLSNPSDRVVG